MTPSMIARFVFPAALAAAGCTTSTDTCLCRGRAVLTDGDTYAFSVEFRPIDTGCCGTLPYPIDASPPTLIDGGQD